jgi:hypothetical protein
MSFIDRVALALFGGSTATASPVDQQLIDDVTETIVDTVEPRVRLSSGYRKALADGVQLTITHLRELGRSLDSVSHEPLVLSRAAWSQDAYVRAFFVAADDIPACIGRSDEVRRFFDQHPGCTQACALLGMKREDRTVLAPRLEAGVMRQDVAQTTVSFTAHRLLAPTEDAQHTRLDIGRRIMQRLAQLVLARIVAVDQEAKDLHLHQAYLGMKRRMLQRAHDGMEVLVTEGSSIEQQIAEVERELKTTTEGYREAKSSLKTLDGYIGHINAVLTRPEDHVTLSRTQLRLSLLGVKIEGAASDEPSHNLDLAELSIGDGLCATIALVRIPREELPPKEDLLARAARFL